MPDHLDIPVPGLGRRVGLARQNGAGGGLGIDRVAFAVPTPEPAVRTIDLNDATPLRGERPTQACAIGAGVLDAEGLNGTVGVGQANELAVTCRCRWNRKDAQSRSEPGDSDSDMDVLVNRPGSSGGRLA